MESAGKKVEVKTWSVDIAESAKFKAVLKEVGEWGSVTCVVFNAARVQPSEILVESEEEIVKDFMVRSNILLCSDCYHFDIKSWGWG